MKIFEIRLGRSSHSLFAIAPADLADAELHVRRVLDECTHEDGIRRGLQAAGLVLQDPISIVVDGPDKQALPRYVRFPAEAQHILAGNTVRVDYASADNLPYLVDPQTESYLLPSDMPFRRVASDTPPSVRGLVLDPADGYEQIPLGPLEVPEEQFADVTQRDRFIRDLIDAGYEVQGVHTQAEQEAA